jgi:hypothetical protein
MADLETLQAFARENFNGLTAPLNAGQVSRLARHWLPEMRFVEVEYFYPVSLEQFTGQVEIVFGALSGRDRDSFRLELPIRSGTEARVFRRFDPPVLMNADNFSVQTDDGVEYLRAWKILRSGAIGDGFEDREVDEDTVLTHGTSFRASDEYFGPQRTLSGGAVGAGNPYVPLLTPITVIATFVNPLEALRYELLTEEAKDRDEYAPDGLRGGLDIFPSLFQSSSNPGGFPPSSRQAILAMIDAQLLNDAVAFDAAVRDLPFGARLDRGAWDALSRFAFLEYYFLYPLNDFNRYETLGNIHEGDDEGCCLVFERNALDAAAASGSEDVLLDVRPHSILTSVHEPFQDADLHNFIPPGPGRDGLDLVVWIAVGSHATYLSLDTHPVLDFSDVYEYVEDALPFILALSPLLTLNLAILALLADLLDVLEDETSDDGVHTGPDELVGNDPTYIRTRIQMLDMSARRHIYQPEQNDLLGRRAYAGKLGGHDGFRNHSPSFEAKTGRYFRRLLKGLG